VSTEVPIDGWWAVGTELITVMGMGVHVLKCQLLL
jgi:hypothetical protein